MQTLQSLSDKELDNLYTIAAKLKEPQAEALHEMVRAEMKRRGNLLSA